jgi:signal transduction histidine kinase
MDFLVFRLTTGTMAAAACFFLAAFSYYKNPKKRLNQVFSAMNFFLGAWNINDLFIVYVSSDELALAISRIGYMFGALISPCVFYLCLAISQKQISKLFKLVVLVLGIFLMAIAPTSLLISDIKRTPTITEIPGPLYPLFIFHLIFSIGFSLFVLLKALRNSTGIFRNQLKYTFLAFLFAFIAGILYVAYIIDSRVPPVFYIPEMIYVGLMGYAILKYRVMDMSVALRRVALLLGIYAGLLMLTTPLIIFIHHKITSLNQVPYTFLFGEILLFCAILSLGPFIYAYWVRQGAYFNEESLASLTHELKSPLSAIEGALDLLIYEAQKKADDPKQKEYLEMIDRNSARLRGFVDELLLVMKSGAKTSQLNFEPVDIAELCRDVVATFEEAAKTKGNTLILQGKESSPLNVDPAKIKKVLSNLLSNANKFTKDGTITVAFIEEKDHVKVQVTDTGMGLAAGDIPYVFETFYQTSAGQKAKGTGIGLSIAKLWVDAHGGAIGAESDGEGEGSCFWFTLQR